MHNLLSEMAQGLDRPTEEDLLLAENELMTLSGESLAGINHCINLSKQKDIAKLQIAAYAYRYVLQRKAALAKANQTAENQQQDLTLIENLKQAERDYKNASLLMGPTSVFSRASLWAPTTKKTQVVQFFQEVFHYSEKKNCLLIGGTGAGKTWGAVAYVAQHAVETNPGMLNAVFITAYKLGELVGRRAYQETDRIEKVRYLIVDDLGSAGSGYKKEDFVGHFENLFATRHQHGRPTLITSNGSLENIRSEYGERFVSRFIQSGCVFVTNDKDMRVHEAASGQ